MRILNKGKGGRLKHVGKYAPSQKDIDELKKMIDQVLANDPDAFIVIPLPVTINPDGSIDIGTNVPVLGNDQKDQDP